MISQIAAAAVGTIAFSLLFSVPRSYYPYCGLIGGVGWLIYCSLEGALSAAEATFFATVGVILLSRFFAVWERCPVALSDSWDFPSGSRRRCLLDVLLYCDRTTGSGAGNRISGS